jgi:ubiquinone/menaquinone biosynthesis C-methylase UbiE
MGYFLISPLRSWFGGNPERQMAPYVKPGMTVLEPGPGMGFFTLPMARLVGSSGRVIAIDIQSKMLDKLRSRTARAGLSSRIETRLAQSDSLGASDLAGVVDFVLAFAMVHELPSAERFFLESAVALKPGGRLLLAEPSGHVTAERFAQELRLAEAAGLNVVNRPILPRSHGALLEKQD